MNDQKTSKQQAQELKNQKDTYLAQIKMVKNFKTNKCSNSECKYQRTKGQKIDSLLLYDCFDFHNKQDQRRPVFLKLESQSTNIPLQYSNNVALETLLDHAPTEASEKHCLNGYEYLYHPLNYKTTQCKLALEEKCQSFYCPYYHTEEEQQYFEEFRRQFDPESISFPYIQELQQNLNKMKQALAPKKEENNFPGNATPETASPMAAGQASNNKDTNSTKNKGNSNSNGNANTVFYVYNKTVEFIEDHLHEFKCLKLHLDTVIKYICGFLNSKGGALYFGINNDGVVKGTEVKDFEISSFKKKLYEALKKFSPPVGEQDVETIFAPIQKYGENGQLTVVPNSYIIEFHITKPMKNDLYFTNYKECFVKRSASINQLGTKEIREYIKGFIAKKNSEILDRLENKLQRFEGRNLDEASESDLDYVEKVLFSTMNKIEGVVNNKKKAQEESNNADNQNPEANSETPEKVRAQGAKGTNSNATNSNTSKQNKAKKDKPNKSRSQSPIS